MAASDTRQALTPAAYAARFDDAVADLVAGAAARVPAFAARLADAGLEAADISGVADLDRLPVLTKDGLLALQHADPPFGGLLAAGVRPRRIFQSPGPIYEAELEGADHWRWRPALEAAGFTADDVVLNAFGYHLSPAGAMFEAACAEIGCAVIPAGVGNVEAQVRACADLGVTAYVGVPSYLRKLLDAADRPLALRRAFVSAEPLPPDLRASLLEDVEVVLQGYGTAETGHLGHECELADGWHVPHDALVQVVDAGTGEAVLEGEGQVVATAFDPDLPLVRFGTGDLSAWHPDPCPCGDPLPRLRGWLGRVGDGVKVRGMFLHPRQVADVMAGVDGVAAYRFTVDRADHVDVLRCAIVPAPGAAAADEVAAAVRARVRDGLRFDVAVDVVGELGDGPVIDDRRRWT